MVLVLQTITNHFARATAASILRVQQGGTGLGSVSSGYILFGSSSPSYLSNSTNLIWNNTNVQLGIGTPTPSANLSVKAQSGATPFAVASSSNAPFFWIQGNTGYVGIGTSTPNYALALAGSAPVFEILNTAAVSTGRWQIQSTGNSTLIFNSGVIGVTATERLRLNYSTPTVTVNALGIKPISGGAFTSASDIISIPSSGPVYFNNSSYFGIGTLTPISLLSIVPSSSTGTFTVGGASSKGACLEFADSDGTGFTYVSYNNGTALVSTASCK